MNSLVKTVVAIFMLIQAASAFVPNVPTNVISTQLRAEVVGIGGLKGGLEVVGIDKNKSKAVGKASKPKAAPKKKTGGFKLPMFKK